MENIKCPCYQCLCLGICKYKPYERLIQCKYFFNFLYDNSGGYYYQRRLLQITKIFNLSVVYNKGMISQNGTFGICPIN